MESHTLVQEVTGDEFRVLSRLFYKFGYLYVGSKLLKQIGNGPRGRPIPRFHSNGQADQIDSFACQVFCLGADLFYQRDTATQQDIMRWICLIPVLIDAKEVYAHRFRFFLHEPFRSGLFQIRVLGGNR